LNEKYEKILQDYARDCDIRNFNEDTTSGYVSSIRFLGEFLHDRGRGFESVTKEDLAEFVSYLRYDRKVTFGTLGNYFSGLNSFYEYLLYEERIQANLIPVIRKRYLHQYKKDEGKIRRRKVISVKDMSDFLGSILNIRDKAICALFVKTCQTSLDPS